MSKTKEQEQAPAPPSLARSLIGYTLGALLGLGALFLLSALLRQPPARGPIDELPHLAVHVEVVSGDLKAAAARQALCQLHRDLIALGDLAVLGPLNYPALLPPATPEELPTAKDLDQLTDVEFLRASMFFGVAGYLTPRVLAPDLRSAVLRAAPLQGGSFGRDLAGRLEELLARVNAAQVLRVSAYSYALQLVDPDARAKLNLHFGVQTVVVTFVPDTKGGAGDPELVRDVQDALGGLKRPGVRSVATEGTFVQYARAVQRADPQVGLHGAPKDQVAALLALARRCKVPSLVRADGSTALIEVTTDAESAANRTLGFDLVANVTKPKGGRLAFNRSR